MRSIKLKKFLALSVIVMAVAAIGCGGPAEEPAKPVENAQKGGEASADGTANQTGATQEQDAS